tara:strand:+ start:9173 stop:9706 length:534 start_codon:yes stop_codon:yes gene_type:complete
MTIFDNISNLLFQSQGNPVKVMQSKLNNAIRSGNKKAQTTTGKTAASIRADRPTVIGAQLKWDFKSSNSAIRLNNGGSLKVKGSSDVPYSGKGGGGLSDYIGALIIWAQDKYSVSVDEAKRIAFAVAAQAKNNGKTVKADGWLDDAKKDINTQIDKDLTAIIASQINIKINKIMKFK